MKILMITPKISGIGGVAAHVSKLVEFLRRDGHEVGVIASENTPIVPIKGLMNPSFTATSALKAIYKRLRGERFDVIHAHNIPSALAMRISSGYRVLTLHGVYSEQIGYLHGSALGRLSRIVEKQALGWANAVTAVSSRVAEHYSRQGFRVLYIPNAIDLEDLPREANRFHDQQIVYNGRLSREKGVDILLEGFLNSDLKAKLVLIGNGPLEEKLREMARNDDRVIFTGQLPRQEALKIVKGSDVFVLPSIYEGLSTALLEAMALEVPVVATRVGGNTEIVTDGETGLLVEPNPKDIIKAVSRLLEDREFANKLAHKAYQKVLEQYTWRVVYTKYKEVYKV
ncbi:Glycosyltransferase [Thermofilum adornatum 1505]|uniref:Glycosyltransferase n=1 Tax=Thermofilum adornatum 1505 TaxID=697581 RepID=A0A3G1A6L4_9CREN|nr:glycosyltransferase family 4 protein [Thermofilum adornatum]AJB41775.1 Glycosyltransferase [Thermofilum adornatum 1505]